PQKFTPPAFVIFEIDQDYSKRLNEKYNGRISFDVAYFSDKGTSDIKSDCFAVQEVLLRGFDYFGAFKALNKNARITDNVLHITFDVNYSEMKVEAGVPMQTQQTNTRTED
ncbi:MAG: phage tail terminator family protein, partial [Ruminiclostridium sp.]